MSAPPPPLPAIIPHTRSTAPHTEPRDVDTFVEAVGNPLFFDNQQPRTTPSQRRRVSRSGSDRQAVSENNKRERPYYALQASLAYLCVIVLACTHRYCGVLSAPRLLTRISFKTRTDKGLFIPFIPSPVPGYPRSLLSLRRPLAPRWQCQGASVHPPSHPVPQPLDSCPRRPLPHRRRR